MAEEKAAPEKAQVEQPQVEGGTTGKEAPRTYSQDEMDRITAKVRRNAARDVELRLRREAPVRQEPALEMKEPPKEDVEPKRDDFGTYEEYVDARAEHAGRKAAREERKKSDAEAQQRTVAEKNQQAQQAWAGKIERAQAKHADFEDVLEDNASTLDLIGKSPMRGFITESDIGPEIIRQLCLKPDEAKRIAALPSYKQAAEIAKIEDTLVAAAKPKEEPKGEDDEDDETPEEKEARERDDDGRFKPKKETPKKLDEPIDPVGPRPARASAEPLDSDDPNTWRRKEVARLAKLRGK